MADSYGNGGPSSDPRDVQKNPRNAIVPKRKRFQPFRAVRRIFSRKSKVSYKDEEEGDEPNSNLKSRSTSELLVVNCQEERSVNSCQPYSSGLSLSHDSIFAPESEEVKSREKHFSHSPKRFSVKRIKEELMNKFRVRQDSDDEDDGLPHSPCTSPTTAEVLRQGLMLGTSERFRSSDGSLLSMGSSGTDTEDYGGSRFVSVTSDPDLDVGTTVLLSNRAARHKISVRPKRNHSVPQNRRLNQVTAGSSLPTTPEDTEEAVLPGGRLRHPDAVSSDAKVLAKPIPSKRNQPRDVPVVPIKRQSRPIPEFEAIKEPVSPTEQEAVGNNVGSSKSRAAERKRQHEIEKFNQREIRENNQKEKNVPSIPASLQIGEAKSGEKIASPPEMRAGGSRLSSNNDRVPSKVELESGADVNTGSGSSGGKESVEKRPENPPRERESAFFGNEAGVKVSNDRKKVPSEQDKVPVSLEKVPRQRERIPSQRENIPSQLGKVPIELGKVPIELEKTPSQLGKVPIKPEKVPSQREKIPNQLGKVPSQREKIPKQQEKVSIELEKVPIELEKVPSQRESISNELEKVPIELEKVPSQRERIPSHREKIPRELEKLPNQSQKVVNEREKVSLELDKPSTHREKVRNEREKGPSEQKRIPSGQDHSFLRNETDEKVQIESNASSERFSYEHGSNDSESLVSGKDTYNELAKNLLTEVDLVAKVDLPRKKDTAIDKREKTSPVKDFAVDDGNKVIISVVQESTVRVKSEGLSQMRVAPAAERNPVSRSSSTRRMSDRIARLSQNFGSESAPSNPVSSPDVGAGMHGDDDNLHVLYIAGKDAGKADPRPDSTYDWGRGLAEERRSKRGAGRVPSLDDDVEGGARDAADDARKSSPDRALSNLPPRSRGTAASKQTSVQETVGIPNSKDRNDHTLKDSRKRDLSPPVRHPLTRNRKEKTVDKMGISLESYANGPESSPPPPGRSVNMPLRDAQVSNYSKRQPVQQQLSQEDMNQLEEEQLSMSLPFMDGKATSNLGNVDATISESGCVPDVHKKEKSTRERDGFFGERIPEMKPGVPNVQAFKKEVDVRIVEDSGKVRNSATTSVFASPERKISATRLAPMEILPYTSSPVQSPVTKSRAVQDEKLTSSETPLRWTNRSKPLSPLHVVPDANVKSNVEPLTLTILSKPASPQQAVPEPVTPRREMPTSPFQSPTMASRWSSGQTIKSKVESLESSQPAVPESKEVQSKPQESTEVPKNGGPSSTVSSESELNRVFEKRRSMKKKKEEKVCTPPDEGVRNGGKEFSKGVPGHISTPVEASNEVLTEKAKTGAQLQSAAQSKSRFMADLLLDGLPKIVDGKDDGGKVFDRNNRSTEAPSRQEDFWKTRSESVDSGGNKKSPEGNVETESKVVGRFSTQGSPGSFFKKEARPPLRDRLGIVIIEETPKAENPIPQPIESPKRPQSIPIFAAAATDATKPGRSYSASKENTPSRSSSFSKVAAVPGRKFSSPSRIVISETSPTAAVMTSDKLREGPKSLVSPTAVRPASQKETDAESSAKTVASEASKACAVGETDRMDKSPAGSTESPPDWMKVIQQRKEMKKQQTLMASEPPTTIIIDNKPTPNRSSKVLDMANTFQHRGLTS